MTEALLGAKEGVQVWELDASHTLVEFSAKHIMITTVKGRFGEVSGKIEVGPEVARVEAAVKADTIDTRSEQRDEHLRSGDFLDVEKFPELRFESKRIEGTPRKAGDAFKVVGDLTIRGVTREVVLDVVFEGTGGDPWGGERASFSAETKIDRRDFGLTWNQALEAGGVLVSNEIRIQLEVQAVKQA